MTDKNSRLLAAQRALSKSGVLESLSAYNPTVVSTIWVGLDTERSDIDIVCCYQEADSFIALASEIFSGCRGYSLAHKANRVLLRFQHNEFLIEVYACATPVEQQPAYRHFRVMERLVKLGGEPFQEKTRQLKQTGLKTEPAIAQCFDLPGNPYQAVLELINWEDEKIKKLFSS